MALRSTSAEQETSGPSRVANAYDAIKDAILNNVFAPGHQGSEQEIALRLGMSRTPVHEALIRLQEEGLVRVLPKRGVIVCPLTPDDMREVYEVIVALEGTAASLLAAKDKAERQRVAAMLDGFNADMKSALGRNDLDAWASADDRFHRALIGECGNGRLARLANTIMDQSHRARVMTLRLRAKPDRSFKEHQTIASNIRRGEADEAAASATQHRRRASQELLPLLNQLGMRNL
jgi:DNA-binding GntR family transcriptional regulator